MELHQQPIYHEDYLLERFVHNASQQEIMKARLVLRNAFIKQPVLMNGFKMNLSSMLEQKYNIDPEIIPKLLTDVLNLFLGEL